MPKQQKEMYRHGWFCWKLDVMSTKVFFHPFCSLRVKVRFSSSRVVLWISGCHLQLVPDHSSAEPMPVQAIRNSRAPWARGIWKTSHHPFSLTLYLFFNAVLWATKSCEREFHISLGVISKHFMIFFPGAFLLLRNSYRHSVVMSPNTPDFLSPLYLPFSHLFPRQRTLVCLSFFYFPRNHFILLTILLSPPTGHSSFFFFLFLRWDIHHCIWGQHCVLEVDIINIFILILTPSLIIADIISDVTGIDFRRTCSVCRLW